jgi:hypothetical protein
VAWPSRDDEVDTAHPVRRGVEHPSQQRVAEQIGEYARDSHSQEIITESVSRSGT